MSGISEGFKVISWGFREFHGYFKRYPKGFEDFQGVPCKWRSFQRNLCRISRCFRNISDGIKEFLGIQRGHIGATVTRGVSGGVQREFQGGGFREVTRVSRSISKGIHEEFQGDCREVSGSCRVPRVSGDSRVSERFQAL